MKDDFLSDNFGKVFKVPEYTSTYFPLHIAIQEGSFVTWEVNQKRKDTEKFMAKGMVIGLYITTFGGAQRKPAARIQTQGKYLKIYPGRKITTVALDKLTLSK